MEHCEYIPVPFQVAEKKHRAVNRIFQGIPSITATPAGRLFAVWYGGGEGEGPENFVMIAISDDHGRSWSREVWVADPPQKNIRAFDPSLFTAPDGTVHCFWSQCRSDGLGDIFDGRSGVWHAVCSNPEDEHSKFRWSIPERICDGVMMNRAAVLSSGEWAMPVSMWHKYKDVEPAGKPEAMIYISCDNGKTFQYRGGVTVPDEFASFDEHSICELSDGRLSMLIRKEGGGYYESFSADRGKNWSPVALSPLPGVCSRGFLGRTASRKLLAVTNDTNSGRRNLTAFLSKDDGKSWYAKLGLDLRDQVSYPDAVQDHQGFFYIIYDHDRYGCGEILCSRITEADIEAGVMLSEESFAAATVSRLFSVNKELLSNKKS